ncbi:MAG: hypothetical protein PQJ49_14170 [Sphaerochaetaceae bacterium]|nr:hypothetical protein [Sphaerochaetaceae bacterium]
MCGCLNKVKSSLNKTVSTNSNGNATVTITRTSSKTVNSVDTSLTEKKVNCEFSYHQVRRLKIRLVLLKKKYEDKMLDEAYETVLMWLNNLNTTCPDNYEFNVLSQFINEYTEYNT